MADALRTKHSGAEWLRNASGLTLSAIGAEAADILGQVFRGLYHMNGRDLEASVWTRKDFAEVRLGHCGLATVDRPDLTELVVLCHDRCVRLEIDARARGYLTLLFTSRKREGGYSQRCPTLEQHVEVIRATVGLEERSDA